ncbi:hypothetical protein KTS45_12490 [Halomicroarcula limicola]|uniref:Uncharacterized protein n=1 Tax=Haloarcula limicola TaxID=1429915 RepID=A0A8J8C900_9EURY|nr:hypothetical protein [Halomicroarcula limicola]MBV0925015.1 hypothetical protein [Halomicroarcula limicola]
MPLIRDDHDVDEVERRLSFLEGSRSFVETVREDRSLLVWCLGNLGALGVGGWITYGATEFALEASSMSAVDIVGTLVIAAIGIGTALCDQRSTSSTVGKRRRSLSSSPGSRTRRRSSTGERRSSWRRTGR